MNADPSLWLNLIRSIAALSFVLGLIITAAWALRRYGQGSLLSPSATGRLKVLEKHNLSTTSTLYLIKHDGHEHLIVVTGSHASLLHTNPGQKKPSK